MEVLYGFFEMSYVVIVFISLDWKRVLMFNETMLVMGGISGRTMSVA